MSLPPTAIAVGSDVLTSLPNAAPVLVNALRFIRSALVAADLDTQIKVSTPHSSSIILDSFLPSHAFFNRARNPVLVHMLKFLQSTNSYFILNVYPYYDYVQSNGVIPLDYALFRPLPLNKEAVDTNTLLHYTNVYDRPTSPWPTCISQTSRLWLPNQGGLRTEMHLSQMPL
eukprot:TRINITY_DN1851_c0_g1_i3.p1 TRINITY_DN1851_c0_g1~~TRINITY_DN1851_c0_g1_i3.p1  ORF type:complete len:172 (-),score=4.52 TRINITY_DN1851_c0_g1_i3:681-1196(-)